MKKLCGAKTLTLLLTCSLGLAPLSSVFAQTVPTMDTTQTAPTTDSTTAPEPDMTEPAADTTGPIFISITAMSAEPTTMMVAWTTDELAYGWVEYGLTDSYGSKTEKTLAASMEQAQLITGLNPNTTYHYRVVAIDEAGNISYSASKTITTQAEPEPQDNQPPTISAVDIHGVTTASAGVRVTTDESTKVRIEYGTTEQYGSFISSGEEFADSHDLAITGLAPDTTYYYRIHAEDVAGNTSDSFVNDFVTAPEPEPTSAPTPLEVVEPFAADLTASTATITWQTSETAEGSVHYGTGSTDSSAPSPAGTKHSVTLTGLQPETQYTYRIEAKTSGGKTATVQDLEFNTLSAPRSAPAIVISDITTSINTTTATITWTTNAKADSLVEYGASSAYGQSARGTELVTSHSQTLTGLSAGTKYYFRITSADAAGNSAITEDYIFTTTAAAATTQPTAKPAEVEQPDINTETETENPATEIDFDVDIVPTSANLVPLPSPTRPGGVPKITDLKPIKLIKAEALDGQALFVIEKPTRNNSARVRIVRNGHWIPKHPLDGKIVYQGPLTSFTDTKLVNGHTYHYAIYAVDSYRGRSAPVVVKITPKAGKTQVSIEATPASVATSPRYVFAKNIALGAIGRDVRHLQLLLAQDSALYPSRLITGYFGLMTKQALTRFQKKHGLTPTGTANANTRKKLEVASTTRLIAIKSSFYRDLSLNSQGSDVFALQTFLFTQGHYPRALFTGTFGPLTKQALIQFQMAQHIVPANGHFGPTTRDKVEHITTSR